MIVLDSSAMLAYLDREQGYEIVQAYVEDGEQILAHAMNLCEVYYDVLSDSPSVKAESVIRGLKEDGVIERNDMDADFWRDVAFLIATRRAQPPDPSRPKSARRLALGDAIGLALARRLSATFVTADRAEISPLQTAGLVQAHFIR